MRKDFSHIFHYLTILNFCKKNIEKKCCKMSSKDNAIEIHSDSDDSSTKTGVQVDVIPEDYVQPDIPSRILWIGDDEFSCLT